MTNATATATVHYDMTGNTFYFVPSTGFCDATRGMFTVARSEVTCPDCLAKIAAP